MTKFEKINIPKPKIKNPEKCWCGYSSDLQPSGCKGSYIVVHEDENFHRTAKRCNGFAKTVNRREIEKLYEIVPQRYNLRSQKFLNNSQKIMYEKLLSKNGTGGWIFGKSGIGKTHLTFLAIVDFLKKSNNVQKFEYLNAVDLVTAWQNKYNDDIKKYNQSLDTLARIHNATLIFIDDIDKIGNITDTREAEFFALFDNFANSKKTLFVTSQVSIVEFCKKMSRENVEMRKTGSSPIQTRLNELCRSISDTEQLMISREKI